MAIERVSIRWNEQLDPSKRNALVLALRLMTASESMRSAVRCLTRLPSDSLPATEADRYYLLFAATGAVGETINMIREERRADRIERKMIESDAKLADIWNRVTARSPSVIIKMALRSRNMYWAHWDAKVAIAFVGTLTGTKDDPPMAESAGQGKHGNTSFRWVRCAWFADLERKLNLSTDKEVETLFQDMMNLVSEVNELVGTLVLRILERSSLRVITSRHDSGPER